jgi:hypothetical protein
VKPQQTFHAIPKNYITNPPTTTPTTKQKLNKQQNENSNQHVFTSHMSHTFPNIPQGEKPTTSEQPTNEKPSNILKLSNCLVDSPNKNPIPRFTNTA